MESSMDTEMQNERCSLEGFEQESNDRLVFPKLFYGREPELKQLRGIYEILVNVNKDNKSTDQTPQNSPLVLISGYSGTGKSALVDHFVQELKIVDASSQKQPHFNNCYLAKGKFDQSVSADPYSALVQAFTNFCTQLQEQPREEREVFKREMQHAVGEEGLQVLSQLIPALQAIAMEKDATSRTATTLYAPHTEYEWNRLSYLFRKLVQAMSTRNRPLILFLDDLQWIDPASLDLLMELVLDSASLKYCMIIGAFRSNEVDDKHPLWTKLLVGKGLSQDAPPQPPQSMIIPLENLSSEVTGKFLADTLWMQVEEVDMLTQAVHERTQGNIFFTKSLLEDLHRKQILYRNPMNDYLWTWDLPKITELQGLSENVVDIITSKLATLPSALQTALGMGSFLRSTFDASTLLVLLQKEEQLKKEPYCVWTLEELEHLLEGAVVEGLLQNSMGCRDYRFAHDKIKQAAHTMVVASDARDQLRVRIAKYLMERGNDPQHGEDWMLFVAADHLNAISPNGMRSLDLVLLNLQVGERAVHVSAFIPAAAYLRKGLDSLTTQVTRPWQDHYDITIRMYRAVADVELCLGYFDKGHELCRVIMQQAQSKSDKLVTSLSLGEALGRQKRHAEAMEVHQEALYLVKAGLPKNFHLAHVLKDFRKARTLFKKYSNYDILLLPTMQDEHKLSVMDHLSALSHRAFYCNKMAVVMLCILRQIRLTFAYGLCPDSAQGFSSYGLILCGTFGDQEFGNRMGRLARSVLELEGQRSKSKECHVLFTIAAYIDAWAVPIPQILQTFQRAHKSGMESGNLEGGYRAWASSTVHAYCAGFPLDQILRTSSKLLQQLKLYSVEAILVMYDAFRFTILHLMGVADTPVDWTEIGKAPIEGAGMSETFRWIWYYWSRLQLAYYFGKLEIVNRIVEPFHTLSAFDTSYIVTSIRCYFSGLTACGMMRRTGKEKYKRRARKATREMEKIMRSRGLNNLHRYLLMRAELLACEKKKSSDIKKAYEKAIASAGKVGFTQDAALGNELAGEYFLTLGDTFWTKHYFTRAHELYQEWGAKAKSDHLLDTRGEYIEISPSIQRISTVTSSLRHWVSGEESDIHKSVNLDLMSGHTPSTPLQSSSAFSVTSYISTLTTPSGLSDHGGSNVNQTENWSSMLNRSNSSSLSSSSRSLGKRLKSFRSKNSERRKSAVPVDASIDEESELQ